MRDQHQATVVVLQKATQPGNGIRVQVVCRLIEQQCRLRLAATSFRGEQDMRQLHAATLTTGQRTKLLIQNTLRQAQVVTNMSSFSVGFVAAKCRVALFEPGVLTNSRITLVVVANFHQFMLAVHGCLELIKATGREHAIAGGLGEVSGLRILRKIPDFVTADHFSTIRVIFSGENLQCGGFARTIPTDEADPVARLDTQLVAFGLNQGTCANADFKIFGSNHEVQTY